MIQIGDGPRVDDRRGPTRILAEFWIVLALCIAAGLALMFLRPTSAGPALSWPDWILIGLGAVPPLFLLVRGLLLRSGSAAE